jgi:hypothetical protein
MHLMNTTRFRSLWVLAALLATAAAAPAQDVPRGGQQEQTKAPIGELIEQLGDRNYQVRRDAETALRSRGQDALAELRKAAESHSDAEVQWRARRLVKQLESGDDGSLQRRDARDPSQPGRWRTFGRTDPDLEHLFGDMFERLERDFGMDVPRMRFFHDDFFQSLQEQMRDLRQGGVPGAGQAFSMRVGPDGVRVEVTERTPDGKGDTKVYEAPDLQSFREKYPDIARRYMRDDGMRFGWRAVPPMPRWQGDPLDPQVPPAADIPEGERLGVLVQEVPEPVREFLGLQGTQGLRVEEVTEGSLAQTLGLEAGDILLQVGSKAVHDTTDVRAGLAEITPGSQVTVRVNRRGAEKDLSATKPQPKTPADKENGSKKLEKRDTNRGSIR